jgi:copper chaperone CopZ
MENKILKVSGMHCKSCEIILKEEIEDISGVESATPNHEKDIIKIIFDGSYKTLELIKETIKKEGYKL